MTNALSPDNRSRHLAPTILSAILSLSGTLRAEVPVEDIKALKKRWKAEYIEVFPTPRTLSTPHGHDVRVKPTEETEPWLVLEHRKEIKYRMRMRIGAEDWYITQDGWSDYPIKKSLNWVRPLPANKPAPPPKSWLENYEDLKHDARKHNCTEAYVRFRENIDRKEVITLLKTRIYQESDPQAKSCVMALLCNSKKFEHDAAFARLILDHLKLYVNARSALGKAGGGNHSIEVEKEGKWRFATQAGGGLNGVWSTFLVFNAPLYQDLLREAMLDPKSDIQIRWICMHALERHGLLAASYRDLNTTDFFDRIFQNLKDDGRNWNALWATRMLIILKPISTQRIKDRLAVSRLDDQEKYILKMLPDEILKKDNRAAFEKMLGDLSTDAFGLVPKNASFDCDLPVFRVDHQ